MAELQQLLLGFGRAVELWTPIGESAAAIHGTLNRLDNAIFPAIPCLRIEQMASSDQWQRSGNEAVHGTEMDRPAAIQVLRPQRTPMLRRPLEVVPECSGCQPKQLCPSLLAC